MGLKMLGLRVKPLQSRVRYSDGGGDAHYQTPAHKAWRKAVLQRDGYRCQGAGPHGGPLHADHVEERRDGGASLDVSNGVTLCQACHNRKTARERAARAVGPV